MDATVAAPVVVTLGNPNTGKSTLFNALTGLRQQVGNFAGVTVEYLCGQARCGDRAFTLVDLPGTYAIAPQSPDEIIAIDVLNGALPEIGPPAAILVVVDATNLRRNLFLATQLLALGRPVIVAVTMIDLAREQGIEIDLEKLSAALMAPVIPVVATRGEGLDTLRQALSDAIAQGSARRLELVPGLAAAVDRLAGAVAGDQIPASRLELERAIIDEGGYAEQRILGRHPDLAPLLEAARADVAQGQDIATFEARHRYGWINRLVGEVERRAARQRTWSDRLDGIVNHPVIGAFIFVLVMAAVFQSVFAWATPLMEGIDSAIGGCVGAVHAVLGDTLLASLIADGVISGVGSVVIFLPQIVILLAFIIVLEDTGYMARAAFMMDRVMRWCGLSGQSFIPLLSSFACAVPGIMGTRVIGDRSNRISTIVAAPFMTCSARLPVYALLIAAFVPDYRFLGGWLNLHGLVMLALYFLGIVGAIATAWIMNRFILRGARARFLMEMPPYRMPAMRAVLRKLMTRVWSFLKRAGTIIFAVAVVVWALASFPRVALDDAPGRYTAPAVADSYLGMAGRTVAPLTAPLGWDWKVTAAVIASFPAREVVIATLGTIYAVDTEVDEDSRMLSQRLKASVHANGDPVFTLPMALGLMLFYALCLQCVSTIAVMWRETGTWRWPAAAWLYMTGLGYGAALLANQLGSLLAR